MLPVSAVMTTYAITEPLPNSSLYKAERITQELPSVFVKNNDLQSSYWTAETVQAGDSLADVLARAGISEKNIKSVLAKSNIDNNLKKLNPGQTVSIRLDSKGDATDIQFFADDDNGESNLVAIEKVNGQWQASASELSMRTMPSLRSIIVRTSAQGALAQAGVGIELRESLRDIFSDKLNIDELRPGDQIRLLYNSMYFRGQEMATGDILAAEVVKGGKVYKAYYYDKGDEGGSYYDEQGKSLKHTSTFNVQPVAYTRISSPYGLRVHPVLHTVRMHTGIDYAAPEGTPIHAPADGIVTWKGWKGGYGNTIMLTHANGVETLYGHMSAYAPIGNTVKAGDVIGYVGTTGRSTGPHLHYEARINGQHVNPTTVALPTPKMEQVNMAKFNQQRAKSDTMLSAIRNLPVTVAQVD
ncbi:MAG: LysM peptidoglycan-binding domain-containing M23 family metallopeptidase [Neisseria sp.]|uniref:M23 family metallopeptidase n=1 Tax=Neisseria sp. TaxID=192066 RepID=UPI0026DD2A54|nr:LysM peptidoglycan-binding domain-containing M23 family metallopeptidase [Neisseria sp.]MDO4641857.1 LysM peptidoglycan-binding domain-containing M23 family metallopeptidase [Neisseria sp.]